MPNVHLTEPMQEYVQGQIKSGAYANTSEVVRAGLRLLMEKEGARQFYNRRPTLRMPRQLRKTAPSLNSIPKRSSPKPSRH